MIKNDFDITFLKGVGEKRAAMYKRLGIKTVEDLITFYPRDYIDFTSPKDISLIENGETCVFRGQVTKKFSPYFTGNITVYKAAVTDGTDEAMVTFFNTEFTFAKLVVGQQYLFYGKISCDFARKEAASPLFIAENAENKVAAKYHLTKGLSNTIVSSNEAQAIKSSEFIEALPDFILEKEKMPAVKEAVYNIHFPISREKAEEAKRRLAFEELLVLQLGLSMLGKKKRKMNGVQMKRADIKDFVNSLPFQPTNAQKRAVRECIKDMCDSKVPMNRLLQGDVGSGKTLVAAAVIYFVVKNGYQASLMAPTEILAKQHADTLYSFLAPLGVNVALLTGSLTPKEKKEVKERIKSGEAQVVVGTQALIQKSVVFKSLALSITDEQHRFGVEQRSLLQEKGENPHSLVMSATPIPRTLALMIYADLDISVLDEMPKGRLPIKTYGVDSSYRQRLYNFIIKYVRQGYQAYIICPLIEEGVSDKTAAVKYFEGLREGALKGISMGLLHGRMKQAEKDAVMRDFKDNKISVLVSTTVVEVGVDVPNAVVMVIENAEQFGLSQLHQLRGRVGRGSTQSHCILVTDSRNEYTRARIDTMVETCDGFKIASKDLELRGPGDFFGSAQHGLPALKIADMANDIETVRLAQRYAAEILEEDEALSEEKFGGLREAVDRLFGSGAKFGIN